MADPQRLVDDPEGSQLGRTLLASAAADAPTPDGRATVARRLGLATAALAAGSGQAGGAVVAGALWWKLGALAMVFAIGGAAAIAISRSSAPAHDEPAPALPSVTVTPPVAPPPVAEAPAAAPSAVVEPPEAPLAAPPRPHRPSPRPRPAAPAPAPVAVVDPPAAPPAAAPAAPAEPAIAAPPPALEPSAPVDPRRLAAEVAVLDRARAALRAGDTTAALAALDEHQRSFADGSLLAAAEVVRIETLIQRRELAAARTRAEAFLVHNPRSPLARRVHSLLDRLPAPGKEAP